MVANLYGDFVKGKDYTYLPPIVQKGVLLHREIDDFIDTHPLIKELRTDLFKVLPKIAGIAIDLYADHLLAKNWSQHSDVKLKEFVENFFNHALDMKNLTLNNKDHIFNYPADFIQILKLMNDRNWILRYRELEGLTMASTGLSKRISFENNLDKATEIFQDQEGKITEVFNAFMIDAKARFKHSH